jgi:hypothetical protein
VIGWLPGERTCLSPVWAVLVEGVAWRAAQPGHHLLADLHHQLLDPPVSIGARPRTTRSLPMTKRDWQVEMTGEPRDIVLAGPLSRNDNVTTRSCSICGRYFELSGRRRHCSGACRQATWRRRQAQQVPEPPVPLKGRRRDMTVSACDSCGTREIGVAATTADRSCGRPALAGTARAVTIPWRH